MCSTVTVFSLSVNTNAGAPPFAGWHPGRSTPGSRPTCGPRSAAPPGTATTPARRRTTASPAAGRPGRTRSARHPVELQPQPRLGDPGPVTTAMPIAVGGLRGRDRPAGGPLIPGEPHRDQPLMDHIGADLTADAVASSSTLSINASMILGRVTGPSTGSPASRFATYRRTVLGSTPANTAAECAHPVASNASRISMISLSDFFTVPPVGPLVRGQRPRAKPRGDHQFRTDTPAHDTAEQGDQLSA